MKFKYVIVSHDGNDDIEYPYIFSVLMKHDKVAGRVTNNNLNKVISAGFINIETIDAISNKFLFHCFGESISLKTKSRGQIDSDLIKQHYEMF